MRLLCFDQLKQLVLTDFRGKTIPPYAILSHRWGDAEILLEDIGSGTYKEKKDAYRKLSNVRGPSKGWMRKGEEGCSIETAMYSVYMLNQERNHVTKSHVKIQFTVYRVNFRCQADKSYSSALNKQPRTSSSTSGLTHVALTDGTFTSARRQSTQCSCGTKMRHDATSSCQMFRYLLQRKYSNVAHGRCPFGQVHGLLEGGHFKSLLRQCQSSYFLAKDSR
jgi:hypothetical protein